MLFRSEESGWVTKSPAKAVKAPITESETPTLPFSDEELKRLYEAFPKFAEERRKNARGPETDHLERGAEAPARLGSAVEGLPGGLLRPGISPQRGA